MYGHHNVMTSRLEDIFAIHYYSVCTNFGFLKTRPVDHIGIRSADTNKLFCEKTFSCFREADIVKSLNVLWSVLPCFLETSKTKATTTANIGYLIPSKPSLFMSSNINLHKSCCNWIWKCAAWDLSHSFISPIPLKSVQLQSAIKSIHHNELC